MTKQIQDFQAQVKTYTGSFVLGSTTPSYDLETAIDKYFPTEHISEELIYQTAKNLKENQQKPPIFSALKKDGKRLYEFARAGKDVVIPTREITIDYFKIKNIKDHKIDFEIQCSKGTYIRSLAHDYGRALDSGAHLSALRRTKIGEFSVENAISIEAFVNNLNLD